MSYRGRLSGMQFTQGHSSGGICEQDVPGGCPIIATEPNTVVAVFSLIPKFVQFSRYTDCEFDN